MVTVVLFLFLWNFRTTFISLTAIPLSLVAAVLVMEWLGIGDQHDDARAAWPWRSASSSTTPSSTSRTSSGGSKQNAQRPTPEPERSTVIFRAVERGPPLDHLRDADHRARLPAAVQPGRIRGADVRPAGRSPTSSRSRPRWWSRSPSRPVLCFYLLPRARAIRDARDSFVVAWLKRQLRAPRSSGRSARPGAVIVGGALALLLAALALVPLMGREFLPPFNEGTLNINATLPPGTSLAESNRVGGAHRARSLRETPEVVSTTRRTGRAEQDEHAAGVNASELEVVLRRERPARTPRCWRRSARTSPASPALDVEVGQPISHRIDHLLSGTRAQIAVKLFGPDLRHAPDQGRRDPRRRWPACPGSWTCSSSPRSACRRCRSTSTAAAAAVAGLRAEDLAETVETAFGGHVVSQVLEEQRSYDRHGAARRRGPRRSVETIAPHADRHAERRPRPARPGGRGPARRRARTRSTARTSSAGSSCRPTSPAAISAA